MAMTRRGVLLSAGGGAVALAAGAASLTVLTAEPARALEAWSRAGEGFPDARLAALSWAILAPNPHNRQAWLAELVGDDQVVLRCQLDRRLPETDPFDRQTTIGLGAFAELFRMAAAEAGYRADIAWFPQGEPNPTLDTRPAAVMRLTRDDAFARDPLFAHVRGRRSNKEPYDTGRAVPPAMLSAVSSAGVGRIEASGDPATVNRLRDLTYRAAQVEFETPRTHMESVRLIRIGRSEVEAHPDGIALTGAMPELLGRAGLLTRASLADPASVAFRSTRERYLATTGSAMAHLWIVTSDNSRQAQASAGRDWLRANLAATGLGLSVHPLSQALQEFTEMAGCFRELHAMLAPDGGRVQMLGRAGFGPPAGPSPRWPVESRVARG